MNSWIRRIGIIYSFEHEFCYFAGSLGVVGGVVSGGGGEAVSEAGEVDRGRDCHRVFVTCVCVIFVCLFW